MEQDIKRRKVDITGARIMRNYKRYAKPPYSYVGMTALVIRSAPDHKLSLAGILRALKTLFPFFQGEYQGWKDSVRHNLSHNDCFFKIPQMVNNIHRSKGVDWGVDLTRLSIDALNRQECKKTKKYYAPTLTDHFGLPSLDLVPHGIKLTAVFSSIDNQTHQEVFKLPKPRQKAPQKNRSFTIDALLDSENQDPKSKASTDAFVSHINQSLLPSFPRTMFDDQSPEIALENLRLLCQPNPLETSTKDSVDNSLLDIRSNGSLCEITNVMPTRREHETPVRDQDYSFSSTSIKSEDRYTGTPAESPSSSFDISYISVHGTPRGRHISSTSSTPIQDYSSMSADYNFSENTRTPTSHTFSSFGELNTPRPILMSTPQASCSPTNISPLTPWQVVSAPCNQQPKTNEFPFAVNFSSPITYPPSSVNQSPTSYPPSSHNPIHPISYFITYQQGDSISRFTPALRPNTRPLPTPIPTTNACDSKPLNLPVATASLIDSSRHQMNLHFEPEDVPRSLGFLNKSPFHSYGSLVNSISVVTSETDIPPIDTTRFSTPVPVVPVGLPYPDYQYQPVNSLDSTSDLGFSLSTINDIYSRQNALV